MTRQQFLDVLCELVDENPFAIRAVLRILQVEFTSEVPTLAVTSEPRPRLLVNLPFVSEHCRTDDEVKAVICHEFLHVLLRHTDDSRPFDKARHLAFDAVINAIIHREMGPRASSMMSRYYGKARGLLRLLRRPNDRESVRCERPGAPMWEYVWPRLYSGRLVADDIDELARDFAVKSNILPRLLGSHEELGRSIPEGALADALEHSRAQLKGSKIWRTAKTRGAGAAAQEAVVQGRECALAAWQRSTLALLKRHLEPDARARALENAPREYRLPILSPRDRRAFLRSLWSPFLPDAVWSVMAPRHQGSAQVYLDVSGSMWAEMPLLIALLSRLSPYVRRPFWAFSTEVARAHIEDGQLRTRTTGGTRLSCVLEHLAQTRPSAAVIITDGVVEQIQARTVALTEPTRLHAIITHGGNPVRLRSAGIPFTQLERLPG
jgi:hypothetical protein